MQEFCSVNRSAMADSRFVPNRSLRIGLLRALRPPRATRRLRRTTSPDGIESTDDGRWWHVVLAERTAAEPPAATGAPTLGASLWPRRRVGLFPQPSRVPPRARHVEETTAAACSWARAAPRTSSTSTSGGSKGRRVAVQWLIPA